MGDALGLERIEIVAQGVGLGGGEKREEGGQALGTQQAVSTLKLSWLVAAHLQKVYSSYTN